MSQTTVNLYGNAAFAGMLDGIGPKQVQSYAAEEIIPIAYPVKTGTNKNKQILKATAGAGVIGFALADQAREQTSAGVVQYAIGASVSVLTQGRFWVMTSKAVAADATANLTVADGTLTDASVTTGIEAFTKISVKFLTSTSAAALALVEVK